MGTQPLVPPSHSNSDFEADIAQRDHKEEFQNCVPTHLLAHDAPPPETQV
jgi:hypothetical protein